MTALENWGAGSTVMTSILSQLNEGAESPVRQT